MIYYDMILFILIFIITLIILFIRWNNFSKIYHSNYPFFDILFILIYPLEEIAFLFLYYFETSLRGLWVALIVIIVCLTLIVDKWLLKKQHKRTIKLINSKEGKFKQHYIKRLGKFHNHIGILEKEKKDLLDYINKLEKENKKLQKKRPK